MTSDTPIETPFTGAQTGHEILDTMAARVVDETYADVETADLEENVRVLAAQLALPLDTGVDEFGNPFDTPMSRAERGFILRMMRIDRASLRAMRRELRRRREESQ
eukprot:930176-Rhodomonas_salina.2